LEKPVGLQLVMPIGKAGPNLSLQIGPPGRPVSGLLNFIIDTAASHTHISLAVLEKMGLRPAEKTPVDSQRPDGNTIRSQKYRIGLFTLDGVAINPDFIVYSARPFGCSGLIGQDILDKCMMVHDGFKKIATLYFPDVKT
jgi:hypothetical protein